jgi:hypothetical protein
MFRTLIITSLAAVLLALCDGGNRAPGQEPRSGNVTGELKSKKDTKDSKNTVIEVLAPGEEKPRSYHVQYDEKAKGPIPDVLKAVRAASVGDRVEFEWVATGHGPAITKFQVLKKGTGAKPAKPTLALFAGGADGDVPILREALQKNPGVQFKADDLKFGDFRRDGGVFTEFLPVEIADLSRTDIGAIGKAVASANTSKKEKCPPALFVILRYRPDSIKTEQLRAALGKVKGVRADKSWAGDANIWVGVDGSGEAKLAQITTALHAAGVKFRDPITDIND